MWMMPTRGRPKLAQRLFDACADTGMSEKAVMWVDGDWDAYKTVDPPANWEKHGDVDHLETAEVFNTLYKMYPGERYYGFLEDDVIPRTANWDKKLDIATGDWNVVYCNDGHKTEELRITAIGGEFIRALGYVCIPGCKHLFTDNALTELAKRLGLQVFRPDIVMEHKHPIYGEETDRTYDDTMANWEHDRKAYINWLKDDADNATMRMKVLKGDTVFLRFIKERRQAELSVCIIAKDEEANIAGCIESVNHIADEILVTDTGSKDDTVDFARDASNEVVTHFPWNDNFADARNYNLKQASCEYVLWLDADERVYWEDLHKIHDLLANPPIHKVGKPPAYMFVLQNVDKFGNICNETVQVRMFPRLPEIYWKRAIHEQISWAVEELGLDVIAVPIRIRHYGYTEPEKQMEKVKRNLAILEHEADHCPEDFAVLMHLAHSYGILGQREKVKDLYLAAASEDSNAPNNWRAVALTHIAIMALRDQDISTGYSYLKQALKTDKNCMGAWFQLGELHTLRGDYARAMPIYKRLHESGMPPQLQPMNLTNMRATVKDRYIDTLTMVKHRAGIEKEIVGVTPCQLSMT